MAVADPVGPGSQGLPGGRAFTPHGLLAHTPAGAIPDARKTAITNDLELSVRGTMTAGMPTIAGRDTRFFARARASLFAVARIGIAPDTDAT